MLQAKKERKIQINKNKKVNDKDIFNNSPSLIELLIPDCIDEKRDYIVLGENKYSRCFVLSTYPSKTYLGWLDKIFSLLRRCDIKYNKYSCFR